MHFAHTEGSIFPTQPTVGGADPRSPLPHNPGGIRVDRGDSKQVGTVVFLDVLLFLPGATAVFGAQDQPALSYRPTVCWDRPSKRCTGRPGSKSDLGSNFRRHPRSSRPRRSNPLQPHGFHRPSRPSTDRRRCGSHRLCPKNRCCSRDSRTRPRVRPMPACEGGGGGSLGPVLEVFLSIIGDHPSIARTTIEARHQSHATHQAL